MRSARTTWLLLALTLAAGLWIAQVERRADSTERRRERARRLLQFDPARVTRLRIETDAVRLTCRREGGQWMLEEPWRAPARAGAVARILAGLADMPRGEVITAADRRARGTRSEDYGLSRPRARFELSGEGVSLAFLVGASGRLGGLYLRLEGGNDILATDERLLDLLPAAADDLRDRTLMPGSPAALRKLSLKRPGAFLQLARDEAGAWSLRQPFAAPAESERLDALLNALFAVQIATFEREKPGDLAPYGVEDAGEEVAAEYAENGPPPFTLRFGGAVPGVTGVVYAALQPSGAVVTVPADLRRMLSLTPDELRDRRLLPFEPETVTAWQWTAGDRRLSLVRDGQDWRMTEPWQADAHSAAVRAWLNEWRGIRIEDFLPPDDPRAAGAVFDRPAAALSFTTNGVASAATNASAGARILLAGGTAPGQPILARRDQDLLLLPAALPGGLAPDPLRFRSLRMLNLDPREIREISLRMAQQEWTVERAADTDTWTAREPGVRPDSAALDRRCALVRPLVITEWVAASAGPDADFGFDAPAATLTFRLRGESGLSKTLLLGRTTGRGVYAAIRGQDFVALLDERLAARLTAPLYDRPPAPEPAPAPTAGGGGAAP